MINPILERELKTRMRTWRTPIILMIYLLVLGLVVTLFFVVTRQQSMYMYGGGGFDPSLAVKIYNLIVIGQFVVLMMILPAFSATAISGERERQTLELMLCTDLSPWKIIFGKIMASLSFVFLMIFAAMPFMGIVFIFGGVTVLEIIKVVLFYMLTSFLVCSIGLYCSTRFKRVVTSIIMTYFIMGLLFVGTLIAYSIVMIIFSSGPNFEFATKYAYEIMLIILGPNPGFGLLSFYYGDYLSFASIFNISTTVIGNVKPWMVSVAFDVIVSAILIV
ncbi:MAG: ABC transporter permease subunit, partial [Vallitaleaceae bacterium]|nr:ABC transporter permease subunit [Vallitaleaceae bacterium]